MSAIELLNSLSTDPWIAERVWQYDPEQGVGVVALAYASAVIASGGEPPNACKAAAWLSRVAPRDGGHSAEWWAVQVVREIGWLLAFDHPDGVERTQTRWFELQRRWAVLEAQMDAWLEDHVASRAQVAAGTHLYGWAEAARYPQWLANQHRHYQEAAEWVDGGGMARFRTVARHWALRAGRELPSISTYTPDWMGATAFREAVGIDWLPLRTPPDPGRDARVAQENAAWERRKAANAEAGEAATAAVRHWQAAVDAAFPDVPWHRLTAYMGGVGPH